MTGDERIRQAMVRARQERGQDLIKFARALSRQLGERIPPEELRQIEDGARKPTAAALLAAAELAGQPVSSLLGELEFYDRVLPELLRRLADLEDLRDPP